MEQAALAFSVRSCGPGSSHCTAFFRLQTFHIRRTRFLCRRALVRVSLIRRRGRNIASVRTQIQTKARSKTMKLQTCFLMLTMAAFGSGGGGDAGGGGGAAAVPVVPGQVLLHDSFGWGPNSTGMRPTGGTGTFQWMGQHDLSSDWAEIPANNTEIWSAPGGRQAHTWQSSS